LDALHVAVDIRALLKERLVTASGAVGVTGAARLRGREESVGGHQGQQADEESLLMHGRCCVLGSLSDEKKRLDGEKSEGRLGANKRQKRPSRPARSK
jgi:hypothetical protein